MLMSGDNSSRVIDSFFRVRAGIFIGIERRILS
jgi:hypothetical protein